MEEKQKISKIRQKIRRILMAKSSEKKEVSPVRKKSGKQPVSLLQYFHETDREKFWSIFNSLSFSEQSLLKRAYGEQLDNSEGYSVLSSNDKIRINNIIIHIIISKYYKSTCPIVLVCVPNCAFI